eukprot:3427159-Alexandrium_andersonii.AAC.1
MQTYWPKAASPATLNSCEGIGQGELQAAQAVSPQHSPHTQPPQAGVGGGAAWCNPLQAMSAPPRQAARTL